MNELERWREVGARIRERRAKLGLSQSAVARRAGIDVDRLRPQRRGWYVSRLECEPRRARGLRGDAWLRIARALDCTVDWLLEPVRKEVESGEKANRTGGPRGRHRRADRLGAMGSPHGAQP